MLAACIGILAEHPAAVAAPLGAEAEDGGDGGEGCEVGGEGCRAADPFSEAASSPRPWTFVDCNDGPAEDPAAAMLGTETTALYSSSDIKRSK